MCHALGDGKIRRLRENQHTSNVIDSLWNVLRERTKRNATGGAKNFGNLPMFCWDRSVQFFFSVLQDGYFCITR